MKSSVMILSGAAVAMAGPLRNREVDIVYDVVTNVVTEVVQYTVYAPATEVPAEPAYTPPVVIVTVTVDPTSAAPAPSVAPVETPVVHQETSSTPTTSSSPETAVPTAAKVADTDDFASAALYHHNAHRANHSAADVTYSDTLAGFAATLSSRCVFEHDVTIGVGSEYPSYGQNIAMYAATDIENLSVNKFLAQSISDYWYNNELELYPGPYGGEPDMGNFDAWGHFSQIVWSGTKEIGCSIKYCEPGTMESGMGAYMSTCNYYPAGNVDTEYAANVLKPLGEATVSA